MPFFRAEAVCEAMQYPQLLVTLTATYSSSLVSGSSAPGPMICLMLSQVRFSVAGSCAIAFQKLLIQSVLRVAMMSSYTARTSGLASWYSIKPNVDMLIPQEKIQRRRRYQILHQEGDQACSDQSYRPKQIQVEPGLPKNRQPHFAVDDP